jgi:hypothetical protein
MGLAFGMAALTSSASQAHEDVRRQPWQPPKSVNGIIPAGFPGAHISTGFLLDQFIYPSNTLAE